jgi:hypothetical protein
VSVASVALTEEAFRSRIAALAKQLAVLSHATFLRVGGGKGYPKVSTNRLGLGAGLPGLYWINVFGPPFVRVVGKDRLLASPAFEVQELGDDVVYLRVSDEFSAPLDEGWADTYRNLKAHIGQEFFVTAGGQVSAHGVLGISDLVRLLWRARAEFRDESINAAIRPEFDWSGIVVPDK